MIRPLIELCPLCGDPITLTHITHGLCSSCVSSLLDMRIRSSFTTVCGRCCMPIIMNSCVFCEGADSHGFKNTSIFYYKGMVREIISLYKFEGMKRLSRLFSELILEEIPHVGLDGYPILVPVPGNPRNVRRRGWDQIEVICDDLCKSGVTALALLKRSPRSSVGEQKRLSKRERQDNVSDMFFIDQGVHSYLMRQHSPTAIHLVIVDDIRTTGATLDSAAEALLRAGYVNISAITLGSD